MGTAFEQAVALLNQHTLLPKCIAFMLDRVLWHCSSTSPDSAEEAVLYPEATEILAALYAKGITAAACQSTVSSPTGALEQLSSAGYRLVMVRPQACWRTESHSQHHFSHAPSLNRPMVHSRSAT